MSRIDAKHNRYVRYIVVKKTKKIVGREGGGVEQTLPSTWRRQYTLRTKKNNKTRWWSERGEKKEERVEETLDWQT